MSRSRTLVHVIDTVYFITGKTILDNVPGSDMQG